jgi:Fis family transcriptional regulator
MLVEKKAINIKNAYGQLGQETNTAHVIPNNSSAQQETHVHRPLCEHVLNSLTNFLNNPENDNTDDLYDIVIAEVERPLFTKVMQFVHGNQTKAAKLLGINRGTLRKKLKHYDLS